MELLLLNGIITALLHPVHPANKLFLISGFPPAMIENKMIDRKKRYIVSFPLGSPQIPNKEAV